MLCWGSPRWGVRRLLAHIEHLPRDSAYVRELQGPMAYWDEQVELTAQVLDEVRLNTYYYLGAHGAKPDKPKFTKRPTSAPAVLGTLADFNAAIGE
jgi:hypothetical protein